MLKNSPKNELGELSTSCKIHSLKALLISSAQSLLTRGGLAGILLVDLRQQLLRDTEGAGAELTRQVPWRRVFVEGGVIVAGGRWR